MKPAFWVACRPSEKLYWRLMETKQFTGHVPMVAMNQIEEFGRRIGREFGAEKVILFGSYAIGAPSADSDVDLLVIGSFPGRDVDTSVEIQMKLRPAFPVDLLVRTSEKVRERIAMGDTFMKEILTQGRILYEAANC